MGDRRSVIIQRDGRERIYLYMHQNGAALPGIVARALKRGQPRWASRLYLSRIIFCEMLVEAEEREDFFEPASVLLNLENFGISSVQPDTDLDNIIVDIWHGMIWHEKAHGTETSKRVSFAQYVAEYVRE